mgnify:CR=1 FL=1
MERIKKTRAKNPQDKAKVWGNSNAYLTIIKHGLLIFYNRFKCETGRDGDINTHKHK